MHLRVFMAVPTSLRSWNDHNAFERMLCLFPQMGVSIVFTVFLLSVFLLGSCFLKRVVGRLPSSASTVPGLDEKFEHNMRNPLLELLFLEQISGIFASFVVEIDLAKITLSSHFALDLLCYKGFHDSA